jgi:hypothetical protein
MTATQRGKSKMENNAINSMFATPTSSIEKAAAQLADFIVKEESQIESLDAALKERKDNLEKCKTQLAQILQQAGLESIKLEGGLTPRAKIVRKYFKQAGITDEHLFAWLTKNDLGGIIKPYVHFQTLQSALKDFECQGNILPDELFNMTDTPTVVMFGKSKYLQQTNAETAAAQKSAAKD